MIAGLSGAAGLWSSDRTGPKSFAFVIHPRDLRDVARKYWIARYLPSRVVSLWTRTWPPVVAGRITGVRDTRSGAEIPGWVVICPLTPPQMLADRKLALRRIRSAIALADRHGATLVGLGGLLPAVTGGGVGAADPSGRVRLTTGRALTPVIVTGFARDCADLADWDLDKIQVAVVGAAGAVGSLTAKLLVDSGARRLMLFETARGRRRIERVAAELRLGRPRIQVDCGTDLEQLRSAALIITATNDPRAIIKSTHLASGTIVIDDAQPSDVEGDVLKRSDVVVIAAGVTRIPGVRAPFFRGVFASQEESFSCLAEVVTLAAHGIDGDFAVGVPDDQEIRRIRRLAAELGITRGAFQNSVRTYSPAEIAAIAKQRRVDQ